LNQEEEKEKFAEALYETLCKAFDIENDEDNEDSECNESCGVDKENYSNEEEDTMFISKEKLEKDIDNYILSGIYSILRESKEAGVLSVDRITALKKLLAMKKMRDI